jgi:hypothetical protein
MFFLGSVYKGNEDATSSSRPLRKLSKLDIPIVLLCFIPKLFLLEKDSLRSFCSERLLIQLFSLVLYPHPLFILSDILICLQASI